MPEMKIDEFMVGMMTPNAMSDEEFEKIKKWASEGVHPFVKALVIECQRSRDFEKEWASRDGNSPGYNIEKARNYGRQAYEYRLRAEAAENEVIRLRGHLSIALLALEAQ